MPQLKEGIQTSQKSYYWAKAIRFQLGGYLAEKRDQQGRIVQAEMPLEFQEHGLITDDPKKIKFIENSHAFKVGRIIKCESAGDISKRTEAHDLARQGVVKVENLMDKDLYSRPE